MIRQFGGLRPNALSIIIALRCGERRFATPSGNLGGHLTGRGHPLLVYVDPDAPLRRHVKAIFRGEYVVESVATVEDLHYVMEPAVAIINLSDATEPQAVWNTLTSRWPTVPAVAVLTAEAAIKRDREALWALGPASIVVNPYSPDAIRRGVAAALS